MSNNQKSTSKFYDHEKLGCIPVDWDAVRLGKDFDFFPTATYSRSQLSDSESCLYIHYGDIHTRFERFIDIEKDYLPSISFEMAKKYTPIVEGDLIISDASEDYEGVGKAVEIVNVSNKKIIAGLHTLHLRVKNDEFIKGFKGYILNQEKVRNSILRIATGIKVYSISKSQLKKIFLPKPPKKEQIEITKILTLVDESITATQNSINKAERLKKSLMQNLLTGKLKPDGTWRKEDEFYKDEKFGYVPKGWKIKKIRELTKNLDSKRKPIKEIDRNAIQGEFPYYGAAGIIDYINDYIFDGKYILFGEDGENLLSRKLPQAFIVIGKFWVNNHAHILEVFEDLIEINFLSLQLESKDYRNIIYGSAQPKINKSDLSKIKILVPDTLSEQIEISSQICEIEKVMNIKQSKNKKLEKLKKALMQNLLTGKLRIKM